MKSKLLKDLAYVRIACSDVSAAVQFAGETLGLQKSVELDGEICFRSDARIRTLSFFRGAPNDSSIGIEVFGADASATVKANLLGAGFEATELDKNACQAFLGRHVLRAKDGSGNNIDFIVAPTNSGVRFFPQRDAGVCGLKNIALRSTNLERDLEFWTLVAGAQIADWVGDVTYLSIDHFHHKIALYPSDKNGILYTGFEVEDLDNIMQNSYFLNERQIKIVQGPGRQAASNQIFLHVAGPEGNIFSFVHGMSKDFGEARQPRSFERTRYSFCNWGTVCEEISELSAN